MKPLRVPSVLIVEDNEILAKLLQRRLAGWPCLVANDLDSGLELAGAYAPAVVALDNGLPDGLGMEHIAEFKARAPGAVVMMMSAIMEDEDRTLAVERGAVIALRKSDLRKIRDYIAAVLSVRAASAL